MSLCKCSWRVRCITYGPSAKLKWELVWLCASVWVFFCCCIVYRAKALWEEEVVLGWGRPLTRCRMEWDHPEAKSGPRHCKTGIDRGTREMTWSLSRLMMMMMMRSSTLEWSCFLERPQLCFVWAASLSEASGRLQPVLVFILFCAVPLHPAFTYAGCFQDGNCCRCGLFLAHMQSRGKDFKQYGNDCTCVLAFTLLSPADCFIYCILECHSKSAIPMALRKRQVSGTEVNTYMWSCATILSNSTGYKFGLVGRFSKTAQTLKWMGRERTTGRCAD